MTKKPELQGCPWCWKVVERPCVSTADMATRADPAPGCRVRAKEIERVAKILFPELSPTRYLECALAISPHPHQ